MDGKAAFTLALLTLAAGCVAPFDDAAPEVETAAAVLDPPSSTKMWHSVQAQASPDFALTAFWWTVPEDAVYPDAIFEEYDTTVLEAALLPEDGVALSDWAVLAFQRDGEELTPLATGVWTPIEMSSEGLMSGSPQTYEPDLEPFHLRLGFDSVEAGDEVAFVVAARSEGTGAVKFAFRALESDPGWDDEPASSASAFLKSVKDLPEVPLQPSGTGAGLQPTLYMESNMAMAPYFLGNTILRVGEPEVSSEADLDARPVAADRAITLGTSYDHAGWASAFAIYWGESAVGEWSGEMDLHGTTASGGGTVAQAAPLIGASFLTGMPAMFGVAEGEAPSMSEFRVDARSMNANGWEILVFDQLDLGATLEDLTGVPADSWAFAESGLATAGITPRGDLEIVRPDGSRVTYAGLGHR